MEPLEWEEATGPTHQGDSAGIDDECGNLDNRAHTRRDVDELHHEDQAQPPSLGTPGSTGGLIDKWAPLLNGVEGNREVIAALLKNQAEHLGRAPKIGSFQKFTFPIIRRSWPTLVGGDLVEGIPKKTPLQEFAERVWSEEDPTDDPDYVEPPPEPPRACHPTVSVQPMTQPVGGIAFYRPKYGASSKGGPETDEDPLQEEKEEACQEDH